MKKISLLIALFATMFGNAVFAIENENVNQQVKNTFATRFPNAKEAHWSKLERGNAYQVTFIYNNERLVGFINTDGRMLGFARNFINDKLPFLVNETLEKKYKDYIIKSAEELTMDTEVSYLFTVENDKVNSYIRIYADGSLEVLKKNKK